MTSSAVPISVVWASETEWRIDCDRSTWTSSDDERGIVSRSSGSIATTRSTSPTTLAPGWRVIATMIAGSPLNLAMVRRFS